MAQGFYDLVQVATATVGTGTLTLGSPVSPAVRGVPAAADGQTLSYCLRSGTDREVGKGVYDLAAGTLTRATLEYSSTGSKLVLTGNADVYIVSSAGDFAAVWAAAFATAIAAIGALTPAANKLPMFSSGSAATLLTLDADTTLAANSDAALATQKAVKAYVDALVQGLSWKKAVRVATTAAGTLASSFENGDTVDGVVLATGDRILIKNQSSAAENGLYTVNASGAPTRATDADSGAELVNAAVFVSEGTTNADTQWVCTTNATITLGSTSLTFVQTNAAGVSLSGNNTWTGKQDLTAGGDLTPAATPATNAIGYLGAPQNLGLDSGNYTLVMGDAGKSIDHTDSSARDLTIPANGSVAFPIGTVIIGSNEGSGVVTIKITTDTLRWGSSTGQRAVAQHGSWALRKVASTTWRLTGDGIT